MVEVGSRGVGQENVNLKLRPALNRKKTCSNHWRHKRDLNSPSDRNQLASLLLGKTGGKCHNVASTPSTPVNHSSSVIWNGWGSVGTRVATLTCGQVNMNWGSPKFRFTFWEY